MRRKSNPLSTPSPGEHPPRRRAVPQRWTPPYVPYVATVTALNPQCRDLKGCRTNDPCPVLNCSELADPAVKKGLIESCRQDTDILLSPNPNLPGVATTKCCYKCPRIYDSNHQVVPSGCIIYRPGYDKYPSVYRIAICEHERRRVWNCKTTGSPLFDMETYEHWLVQARIGELVWHCTMDRDLLDACYFDVFNAFAALVLRRSQPTG